MSESERTTSTQSADQGFLPVWDIPVRLFHWAIVVLMGLAWWSAEQRLLDWHRYFGYSLLTLVLFRFMWGAFGSTTARFASFLRGPRQVFSYCRGEIFMRNASPEPGHNPLGGWSALTMLTLMLLQPMLGLFAVDIDGIESGPLAYLVSFDVGRIAAETHHLVFNVLSSLVGLHIAAILFHFLYKRENLIGPMISGGKLRSEQAKPFGAAPLSRAFALLVLCATLTFVLTQVFGR
jgi:cytochrome b